jgi:putative nucleotidyltransferase with HDIG domain
LLLTDENGQTKIQTGRNWQKQDVPEEDKALSRSIVNQVIETGEPVLTTNAQEDPRFEDKASVMYYGLRSIMCVPLVNQEGTIGAIYADHRSFSNLFSPPKLKTLSNFANQAAIALRNASLYEELEEAYYTTLVGWAKALELRDENTEGHTQRVTEMTIRLAEEIGIDEAALVHIQRGAILHDIGKMAIPDNILLKPGKLTEEERAIMCEHPNLAMEMISNISFLKEADAIPSCHHEKWDGTGYPNGLKGEDIPLPARIFCIVDVWDALTSDRPYRAALPKEEVLSYLRSQSGTHFDPTLLNIFINMVESGKV